MKFTAVVVGCDDEPGVRHTLGCLRYQTRPPDETIVIVSDTAGVSRLREQFPEAEILERPRAGDWGHAARAEGLARAAGDWVGWFNSDDRYDRRYLEKMLALRDHADVVFCGWNEQPDCVFRPGSSTAGNFIVRTAVARRVGWNGRHYEADGDFIAAAAAHGRVVKVNEVLYTHNPER